MKKRVLFIVALALMTSVGLLIGGCGGDDEETTTQPQTQAQTETGGPATLEIKMGDFFFEPKNVTTQAGPTTIKAPNVGKVEHELVVFKSDLDPAKLPTKGPEVDEEELEEMGAEEAGEIEAEPGETESKEFDLTAGKYVMICNIPGHYEKGMYGSLTATE